MRRGGGVDVYVKWARPKKREREMCAGTTHEGLKASPFFLKCGPELQSDF